MTQYHCLTIDPKVGRLREIQAPFGICASYDPNTTPAAQRPPFVSFNALWDTGATNCAITQKVVDACGLKPFTFAVVNGVHGPETRPVFMVNLAMYQGPTIYNVAATLADLAGADALIGMDVITFGDFSITNEGGNTVFSFRIPSQHTIDYVAELNKKKAQVARPGFRQPGHNNKARGKK